MIGLLSFYLVTLVGLHLVAQWTTPESARTLRYTQVPRGPFQNTVHCVTFGDGPQKTHAQRLERQINEKYNGHAVIVHRFDLTNIGQDFHTQFGTFLKKYPKGLGLWIWKPWILQKIWQTLEPNDILWYMDGALIWTGQLSSYIQRCHESRNGGLFFGQMYSQKKWTKENVYEALGMPQTIYESMSQIAANCFFVQKRKSNHDFFRKFLHQCSKEDLLNDVLSEKDVSRGVTSRHDQSILSLLVWQYHFDIQQAYFRWHLDFPQYRWR